jgi:hypothetical protein
MYKRNIFEPGFPRIVETGLHFSCLQTKEVSAWQLRWVRLVGCFTITVNFHQHVTLWKSVNHLYLL